jgi:putative acetyltransferase
MWIDTANRFIPAVALAPMAVLPAYQRQGIGGRLIRDGLERLRRQGEEIVVVVGHPDYYPASVSPAKRHAVWKVHFLPTP